MNDRRRFVPVWVPLLFGMMALTNVLTRPSFLAIRVPDALQLVAVGLCFGVAFTSLIHALRGRRSS